jgi:predicted AAA+ superfamily ATPase
MEIINREEYIGKINAQLGKGEAIVLTGHRRAGKSCVLESVAQRLKNKGHVIYLDMEDPNNADITTFRELHDFVQKNSQSDTQNYLFIDEVQEIKQFEKTLRFFVKQDNFDVIVTGSNASMLSSDIASSFAGRYSQVHIGSLDYSEFLKFYSLEDSNAVFSQYLRWGGLPFLHRIALTDVRTRTDYIGSIYDTIFVKDIVRRRQIRNVTFLDNLAHFIADNSGKIFSAHSIAKYMKGMDKSVSANTVSDYMEALCDTYLIDKVKRYDIKGKQVFEQQEKYYFEDIGIRNYLCNDKRNTDIEKILEGAVYLKLKQSGFDVYVGQLNGKEVDFVAKRGDEVLYVQVSVSVTAPETYEREFGNLKLIRDNYPKYVVTMDPNATLIHDSGIIVCPAKDFMQKDI